jgi:hypothetical protein
MADVSREQVKDFIKNMSLMEAATLVKELEAELGVSAAAPMMAAMPGAGAAAGAAPVEEKDEFTVVLKRRRATRGKPSGHQGRPRAHRSRSQGGEGSRGWRPKNVERGRQQGRGRGALQKPRRPEDRLEIKCALRLVAGDVGSKAADCGPGVPIHEERYGMSSVQVANNFRLRRTFGRIKKIVDIPNLIDIQQRSYDEFLQRDVSPESRADTGLQGVFKSVFPIKDFNETASLEFVSYSLGEPKYDVDECHQRGMTFAAPLKVTIQLVIWDVDPESGVRSIKNVKEQEVYFGEIPLTTRNGTMINGPSVSS